MRSSLFLDATLRRLVVADVSGQPIGSIFEAWPLIMVAAGRHETLETNYQSTLRNIAEEVGSNLHCGGS
jgi:hypothetical protein